MNRLEGHEPHLCVNLLRCSYEESSLKESPLEDSLKESSEGVTS